MKLNKLFAALLLLAGISFAACEKIPNEPEGPTGGSKDTTSVDSTKWTVPADANIPEGAISVAEAREICAKLADKETTGTKYYVKGFVKKLHSKHTQATIDQYGNAQFYMVDEQGASDDFMAYQVYGLDGNKLVSVDQVAVGDYVVIYGELTNYNGTFETVGQGKAYIYWSSNPKIGDKNEGPNPDEATEVTIAQAREIASALAAGGKTTEAYKLTNVIVDTIMTNAEGVTKYGNINLRVKDAEGNTIDCYYTNNLGNTKFTAADQCPKIGATVSLVGPLKNYVKGETTTPEFENAWFTAISETGAPAGGTTTGGDTTSKDTTQTGVYASTIAWTNGTNAYNDGVGTVNGEANVVIYKLSTSKNAGNATLTIPAGVTKIGFYAVAWKGATNTVLKVGEEDVAVKANDGATNNSPYTLTVTEQDYYEVNVTEGSLALSCPARVLLFAITAKNEK